MPTPADIKDLLAIAGNAKSTPEDREWALSQVEAIQAAIPKEQAPDLSRFASMAPAKAPPERKVSGLEAVGRGGYQGATMGWGDEISGVGGGLGESAAALESKLGTGTAGLMMGEGLIETPPAAQMKANVVGAYRDVRDAERAANLLAKKQHPWKYGLSEVGGGVTTALVPGLNVARAATVGRAATAGAKLGAVAGFGGSGADLTTGKASDIGRAVADTAIGSAAGAAGGAAGHKIGAFFSKAPKRVEEADLAGLLAGSQDSTRAKVIKGGSNAYEAIKARKSAVASTLRKEPELQDAIRAADMDTAIPIVQSKLAALESAKEPIYAKAQELSPGVPMPNALEKMKAVMLDWGKTAQGRRHAKAVQNETKALFAKYEGSYIPYKSLRQEVTDWQAEAYKVAKMTGEKSPKAEVAEDIAIALREALHEGLDDVAKANPTAGISRELLEKINADESVWLGIKGAVDQMGTRQLTQAPPTRLLVNKVLPTKAIGQAAGAIGGGASRMMAPVTRLAERTGVAPVLSRGYGAIEQGIATKAGLAGTMGPVDAAKATWAGGRNAIEAARAREAELERERQRGRMAR